MATDEDVQRPAAPKSLIRRYWFDVVLWKRVLLALVLGAIVGTVVGEAAVEIKWMGDIFIRLIRMVVAPLVFFSIVSGIASMGDPKRLGSIGAKTLAKHFARGINRFEVAYKDGGERRATEVVMDVQM